MAAELISVSPSPTRDQDVFGKELKIADGERKLLSGAGDIFLCKNVQVDSHSRKGENTEPRNLVISSSRCYIFILNPSSKLETSFNFLKIRQIQCSEHRLTFHLSGEPKPREFHALRRDSVEIISLITAQLKNVFSQTPLELLLKLTFDPDSLRSEVSQLQDELTSVMDRVDASTIQGLLICYGFLCDLFGVEYNSKVSWYLKNVYLGHGIREIKLSDFDHLSSKEILPIVSALRHNSFFEGIVERDGRLGAEMVEELSYVLNSSISLKSLVLSNCGLKVENVYRMLTSLKNNPRAVLTNLDLSDTPMDERAMEALGSALETLPHGLQQLRLANCKISAKGGSVLANSMKQNKHMQYSLVHLDLSSNPLGPDPLGGFSFLQDAQAIATLKLSNCNLVLDSVVPVLNRGCTQHLCNLDLSNNIGRGKKFPHGSSVAPGLQQFCSSSISISSLNFAGCKFMNNVVKSMLEGLSVNPNITSVTLDVSGNDLGGQGAHQMFEVLGKINCLHQLNFSECGLDQVMSELVAVISQNKKLHHLMIGKNFSGKATGRVVVVQQLASLLAKEDCQLLSLCLDDSHLKEHMPIILEALAENNSLEKVNLCGNQMGTTGACSLAKTLLCNCSLAEVSWDRNETTLRGFQEVAAAMEHNYTLRVMPLPLYDIGRLGGKGVEEYVQKMQRCLCRNHSDERLKVEIAARHRSRLLTATQQSSVVGRELVLLEDLLQWLQVQNPSHELMTEGSEVKKLANNAIKLTDGLYSLHVESEQFQAITKQVEKILEEFMEQLFLEHIKAKSEKMVNKSISICESFLSEENRERLQNLVVCEKTTEFTQAKRDVFRHALPEIINYVNDANVDVAASISELVVEHTLQSIEKINYKLFTLQKETRAKNPDSKVSRNITFRVQEDISPKKKKKRVRRPDPEDENDFVVLPSVPLQTGGPALEHLGKTRPKPARMQRGRSSKKPSIQPAVSDANSTPPVTDPVSPTVAAPAAKVALKPPPAVVEKKRQSSEKSIKEVVKEESQKNGVLITATVESKEEEISGEAEITEESDVLKSSEDLSVSEDLDCEEHRTVVQEPLDLSVTELDSKGSSPLSPTSSVDKEDPSPTSPTLSSVDVKAVPPDVNSPVRDLLKKDESKDGNEDVSSKLEPSDKVVLSVNGTDKSKDDLVQKSCNISVEDKTSTKEDKKSSTKESKRTNLSKNVSTTQGSEVPNTLPASSTSLMNDWEVIDDVPLGTTQSQEVIKKAPPVVKEKPRNKATSEEKKVPILPSQMVLQQSNPNPKMNGNDEVEGSAQSPATKPHPSKTSPSKAIKPQLSKPPAGEVEDSSKVKITPSPAPKPKPKPTVRTKKPPEDAEEESMDTLV